MGLRRRMFAFVLLAGCGTHAAETPDAASQVDAAAPDAPVPDALSPDGTVPDAVPPDATPPTPAFDIAYGSDWTLSEVIGMSAGSLSLVIDPDATLSLDLSDLAVVGYSDDSATVDFSSSLFVPAPFSLPPGHAAGRVAPGIDTFIAPLAPEPRDDTDAPAIAIQLVNVPTGTDLVVHASVQVRIGTQVADLPFVFTIHDTGTIGATPTAANRISSVPG